MSNMMMQVNHTNQTLLNLLVANEERHKHDKSDPKLWPKSFSGLPTKDILIWLDHFENVASYHAWMDHLKALETRTFMDNVAATWFLQLPEEAKNNWSTIKTQLIQSFAHQNITQTALQQLTTLKQQQLEPVAQFVVKLNQLLLRANPTMSKEMKLFFLSRPISTYLDTYGTKDQHFFICHSYCSTDRVVLQQRATNSLIPPTTSPSPTHGRDPVTNGYRCSKCPSNIPTPSIRS